ATISPHDAEAFYKLLAAAERPLMYVGGGINNSNAAPELRAFAERFGIPVVTTLMGIGAMDTTGELALHMLGMHGTAYANYAVEDCDFLFAVGSRFDDRVAGKVKEFAPGAKIAHLDFVNARTFLTTGSMGTMGFGLPAAIGAQLANPGRLVIDVDGDGSIRMNLGELETLTTYDIPVKVLLLNNLGDGMVRQWQHLF